MKKSVKKAKPWVIGLIVVFAFISGFLFFVKSYVDSSKQNYLNKIQSYIDASSYLAKSKILKNVEDLNEDYVNQKLSEQYLEQEFGKDFIWKPDKTNTTLKSKISDIYRTYFGKSIDVIEKDLKLQYRDNKKNLVDITDLKNGEFVPKNIDKITALTKSSEDFLNGFSPSFASLGLSLFQSQVLKNENNLKQIKDNNILKGVVNFINNNQSLINLLSKIFSTKKVEKDYYKNLTIKQAFNKNINLISSSLTGEYHSHHDEDHFANDVSEFFIQKVKTTVLDEWQKVKNDPSVEIIDKFKTIFTKVKDELFKFDYLKIADNLFRYIQSELYFAMYYVINEDLKDPSELLNQKIEDKKFSALVNNKLDFSLLINGFTKVLENQKYATRLLDFLFKRVDKTKVYFDHNKMPENIGTSSLILDIINALQRTILRANTLIREAIEGLETYIKDNMYDLREKIRTTIVSFLKKNVNAFSHSVHFGYRHDKEDYNKLTVQIYTNLGLFNLYYVDANVYIFGPNGIINKIFDLFKQIGNSISATSSDSFNFLKHVLYRDLNPNIGFKDNFVEISKLIEVGHKLFSDQKMLNINLSLGGLKQIANIKGIYGILNLPNELDSLKSLLNTFGLSQFTKKVEDGVKPLQNILDLLKDFGFINNTKEFVKQFDEYVKKIVNYLPKKYESVNTQLNYDLISNLYLKDTSQTNFLKEFTTRLAEFLFPTNNKEDDDKLLLPVIRLIRFDKENKIKSVEQIKSALANYSEKIISKDSLFKSLNDIKNLKIKLPDVVLKHLGIENLENLTILELLQIISKYINEFNKHNPNKSLTFDLSSIGYFLKALNSKVDITYSDDRKVENKNLIKALYDDLDSFNHNNDENPRGRTDQSFYNWKSVVLKLGDGIERTIDLSQIKNDFSYSPLHLLLGIDLNKVQYIKNTIGYALGTLVGGITINDENYNLANENRDAVITIFAIINFTLQNQVSILKDLEYKKAGVYYKKDSWKTQLIKSSDKEIKYHLIRNLTSENEISKKVGNRFEVTLTNDENNSYWKISNIVALDYKN
ncbi:STREFT protein [Mycoplasma feriruminatoris]|uniref:STREFT protein n=1 Tax=Mycoplasma feriruminatoris TaxID=1179777 RepID=A0ABY8HVK0_9MOLU|nr:STREFT protein [Mycoplasma feriruminatoris]WFQ93659.1 STREFT protein [Mycoplasma feriruminatoris]